MEKLNRFDEIVIVCGGYHFSVKKIRKIGREKVKHHSGECWYQLEGQKTLMKLCIAPGYVKKETCIYKGTS